MRTRLLILVLMMCVVWLVPQTQAGEVFNQKTIAYSQELVVRILAASDASGHNLVFGSGINLPGQYVLSVSHLFTNEGEDPTHQAPIKITRTFITIDGYPAELVACSISNRQALLKCPGLPPPTSATFKFSNDFHPGQPVLVASNPVLLDHPSMMDEKIIDAGIISKHYKQVLILDINGVLPGSSGAAVLDRKKRCLGMINQGLGGPQYNEWGIPYKLALSSDIMQAFLDDCGVLEIVLGKNKTS